MKEASTNTASTAQKKQPGILGRLFQKLDSSMKSKAEEQAQKSSCCGTDKGGKCC
jgi:hypothetical protein